jgi:hypothetical protein
VGDIAFWGGQETMSAALKVLRQCPFVLLVEVMHMMGVHFYMTLEGLHYSEIWSLTLEGLH